MADDDEGAAAAAAAAAKEAEDRARADAARRTEEARLRAEALDKFEAAHEAVWAQATAVVNVKAMIPIVLDKATGTYTKWRGMFSRCLASTPSPRTYSTTWSWPTAPSGSKWTASSCLGSSPPSPVTCSSL
jgi:hypothetical protein